ncbi:FAD-dependent oxidoreductase [Dokdonella fugitiva]|uniref:Kynurenine 3-monooxygenase n=1 Tax=Dokdonella fugitiva TaxID=328517 RepID=A0A4R2I7J3_9GAMM|nr:NAD(P)/FAD-dependent oxidoreductase [Dokdonella fugitiva]TCO40047.1 kynurenine 3-monooxygenase [Dokdonella fugitiva]
MNARGTTIVGGGLVGALLATLLAQRGFSVDVFERRPDPRKAGYAGGRSINLALAERGLHGLRLAGLTGEIMRLAVMMRGRMVHHRDGHAELLRYGRDDSEVIWSISRGRLNIALIDAAERAGARFHFDRRLVGAEFADGVTLHFHDDVAGTTHEHACDYVLGADGAGSAVRAAMNARRALGERVEELGHGYKELEIPAAEPRAEGPRPWAEEQGRTAAESPGFQPSAPGPRPSLFALEPNALHIWPRGAYMCIALPNAEGSFTVTLFLPNAGDPSFATVATPAAARALFERDFTDLLPLIPELEQDFGANPVGVLSTLYLDRWHLDGRALLLGDAAHAIVPFHGQGMNCGFEDAVELAALLDEHDDDLAWTFAEFERRRRPNAEAIAKMALENYVEMRDSVADAGFLLRRELGRVLAGRHPARFVPRYSMVTFTRMPYAQAFARGAIQDQLLHELTAGIDRIDDVDLERADRLVRERLSALDAA